MQRRSLFALLVAGTLVACGGAGTSGGPSPSNAVMISQPSMGATFITSDTVDISIDTGVMGVLDMQMKSGARVALTFADDPAGFKATATYESLDATMNIPMQGTMNVDESDVSGSLGFTVDDRGRVTVLEKFQVEGQASQAVSNAELAHSMFPRLPSSAPSIGDSWVDTLSFQDEIADATTQITSIVTYTIEGDTTVAGTRLLKISTMADEERSASGSQQGMSMTQILSGTSQGMLLWDPVNSLLYESAHTYEMAGSMEVDMAGAPEMSLSMSGKSRTVRATN